MAVSKKKRAATALQKARAKKLGIRVTKMVRGKRVYIDAETLKKKIQTALNSKKRKKVASKKKKTTRYGTSDTKADKRIKASQPIGERKAKKYAKIKYKKKNPKTGKMEWVTVRRKNATSSGGKYITPTVGRKYTERRRDRTDSPKGNI
jgi:hypothetical protein